MHHINTFISIGRTNKSLLPACIYLCVSFFYCNLFSQSCPPNIDFEQGNFSGWKCYTGFTAENGNQNNITLTATQGPVPNRQTIYRAYPSAGYDEYGGFPINCPNGSGYSIKLGNNLGGGQAEGISYEFIVPATQNVYTLIYNYAVVFQDPAHLEFQQPRMEIEIKNLTDNRVIDCSSFTFFPNGSPLPGFQLSPIASGDAPVWYKTWSAVSINLDGNAGKRIRLFFKTADCTFRRHFGYAYIDVNSECSGRFVGASFCADDTAVHVVAPYGYESYNWYNSNFSQALGSLQTLTFSPPPAVGSTVAVIVKPYNGYGCLDTLYTDLLDNLVINAKAGNDTVSCNGDPVQLGAPPKPGERYHWIPSTGLSDTDIANPIALPAVTTIYYLNTRSLGGGCSMYDTVLVKVSNLDPTLFLDGKESFCLNTGDSAVLSVFPTDTIQWYRDGFQIAGVNQTRYNVIQTGVYHARLSNQSGCVLITASRNIKVSSIPAASFTVLDPSQCMIGNSFSFTNHSTNVQGEMHYRWLFGDSSEASVRDIVHTYSKAGIYRVKLIVSSNDICADTASFTIQVHQNPMPEFIAKPVCINLPMEFINQTADTLNSPINYLWDLGNGTFSDQRTPPSQVYQTAGVYTIRLSVSSAQCPSPLVASEKNIFVDKPRVGIRYPDQVAVEGLPLDLQARPIVDATVLWQPGINLNNPQSFTPVFTGTIAKEYSITLTTESGCITVDSQSVKIVKNIAIYVPSAFTPDNDGTNDVLRPFMFGIKKLNWFKIYNRGGELMFIAYEPSKGWDGTYKGRRQEMQTYVWLLEGLGADGKMYSKKGTTVLVR
ncbi:MAG: PKD domain-containing protein [Ferruginibacter sp.]